MRLTAVQAQKHYLQLNSEEWVKFNTTEKDSVLKLFSICHSNTLNVQNVAKKSSAVSLFVWLL